MSDPANVPVNKAHRARRAGAKVNRKRAKEISKMNDAAKPRNHKAFGFASAVRARVNARFSAERMQKKEHAIITNRDSEDPAPILVAVVGPPGVGKSTLVKSLVKHYVKQNLHSCTGPISIVTGKARRITVLECPNDMGAMIDVAKTADLVLLLVDASFGFEMETFEFLNVLKTHGFPKVIGVLTHLDAFRESKTLKALKKTLKQRFWTEICDGAKLFYLSGLLYGRYPRREMANLARFIGVAKLRPLSFRSAHSYVLCDRVEDMTAPALVQADPLCDRTVALYGYVRGTHLKPAAAVHLIGVGDFNIDDLQALPDPLPSGVALARAAEAAAGQGTERGADGKRVRRSLKEKDRQLYAPMADTGGVVLDKDALYISLRDGRVTYTPSSALVASVRDEDNEGRKPLRGKGAPKRGGDGSDDEDAAAGKGKGDTADRKSVV